MAIDPIQFQGFTERQGFDPIKVPDPNPFLRENLGVIDASLENLKQGNLANMRAKADAYSKQLAQLSKFSQTLTGFLGEAGQIYDKKQQAAANALFYEDMAKQDEEVAAFEEGEKILQDGDAISSRAAVAANRNGAPYSVSKRIAELGGLKGHYYRVQATQEISKKYGDFYDEARRTDERELTYGDGKTVKINKTEPTEIEEAVIRAALREEYMEEFDGISRGMIAKYAFPTMRQVDETRATLNSDRIALSDSERERAEKLALFVEGKIDLQTLADSFSRTVKRNRDGKVVSLQYGGGWEQIQTDLLAMAEAGKYVDLIGLVKQNPENPVTKKNYMDDPVFSTKLMAIQAEIRKAETSRYSNNQAYGQVQLQSKQDQILAEMPTVPVESDYIHARQKLEEYARYLGVQPDFRKLDDHQQRFSRTAIQTRDAIQKYDSYLKDGTLGNHVEELSREPAEIQEKYLAIAKQQREILENERGFPAIDKELQALIKNNNRIKIVPGETGSIGKNSEFVLDHVKAVVRSRTNELIQTEEYNDKPVEAARVAVSEIKEEVTKGLVDPNSIYYVGVNGYDNFLKEQLKNSPVLAANRRLQTITRLALDQGKGLLESKESLSAILDEKTLVKAAEGWGRPGYRMDPAIEYLADRLNLTSTNVVHRARATFGLPELPALKQFAARSENAGADFRSAVKRIMGGNISQNQFIRTSGSREFPVRPAFQAARPAQVLAPIDSSNHPIFVSIGVNEGTRTANGGYTKNWSGHTDPGDGHNNRGTVSGGRGNNRTPEQVDKAWMAVLAQEQTKHDPIVNRFVPRGTDMYNIIMFNILDLRVQAPAALPDFVKRIPAILAEGATPEVIGRLRAEAFINPRTGRLEASGFNNNMDRLRADQTRRAGNFRITGGS